MKLSSNWKKYVFYTGFSIFPVFSSFVSTYHLIELFSLGNPTWLAIMLAITFEIGSLASLLALAVLDKIKQGPVWFIFIVLSALQIIGNVYYSFNYTSEALIQNQEFLTNFRDLFSFIIGDDVKDIKILLSVLIGATVPMIALAFLKGNVDYVKNSSFNIEPPVSPTLISNDTIEFIDSSVPDIDGDDAGMTPAEMLQNIETSDSIISNEELLSTIPDSISTDEESASTPSFTKKIWNPNVKQINID